MAILFFDLYIVMKQNYIQNKAKQNGEMQVEWGICIFCKSGRHYSILRRIFCKIHSRDWHLWTKCKNFTRKINCPVQHFRIVLLLHIGIKRYNILQVWENTGVH